MRLKNCQNELVFVMNKMSFLDLLPTNFRHEKAFLIKGNILDFEKLSNLTDSEIDEIQRKCVLCTKNNLRKLRAIAILKRNRYFSIRSLFTFALRNSFC